MSILAGVTKAGGYSFDVIKVAKTWVDPELVSIDAGQCDVRVLAGLEEKDHADESGSLYVCTAVFAVCATFRVSANPDDEDALADFADTVKEELQNALLQNESTASGLTGVTEAKDLTILSIEPKLLNNEGRSFLSIIVAVTYYHGDEV